ncbi:MAG: SGNH/GDSL hydrolase family protein [Prosthecobacter sp.]|nr:SGNH/GDSL hydrolase family protein [Prosthecobacter sp.]
MLRPLHLLLLTALLPIAGTAEQCLVIGDSLTKEYEVEFPALFPDNPESWDSRNWIEILHQRRTGWFDTGLFSQNNDVRLVGHEYNWAFPGATSTEIKSQISNPFNFWWTDKLENHLKNIVERVVIFAGGNDVDSYYGNIYNGASPPTYTNATLSNLQWIVDYVRTQKPTLPIVLVAVPHLGCAPDVQLQYPTDPVKTARVTAALDTLNVQLAAFAQSRGIGFAAGAYDLTKAMIDQPFRVGGIDFYKQADMDARPRYLFSGDGFHPNTCAHAKIAQIVINAFRAKYPASAITTLGDKDIVTNILGLDPNIPFNEWIAAQGTPANQSGLLDDPDGDGLKNSVEFALQGASAVAFNALSPPTLEGASLTWNYHPNPIATEWGTVKAQYSSNLQDWQDVPAANLAPQPDGSVNVQMSGTDRLFLRLSVSP